jgi:hypothetical protein
VWPPGIVAQAPNEFGGIDRPSTGIAAQALFWKCILFIDRCSK